MNYNNLVKELLTLPERPSDGLLHASMDITDSLRHVMLRAAGAPTLERHHLSLTRALSGTLVHEYFDKRLSELRIIHMNDIPLKDYMPQGWSGTADWLIWDKDISCFILFDLKTTSEFAMPYIPKTEHIMQVSAYYDALDYAGFPMNSEVGIIYIPMDTKHNRRSNKETVDFSIEWVNPILDIRKTMKERQKLVTEYLLSVFGVPEKLLGIYPFETYLTDKLALSSSREQKLFKKKDIYELKLVPQWITDYCPYDINLCDCSTQGETKIGEFKGNNYYPRAGFEEIEPTIFPKE